MQRSLRLHRARRGTRPARPRLSPVAAVASTVVVTMALAASAIVRASDSTEGGAAAQVDPKLRTAWQVLRNADCARCHGRNYDGLAAPSIVEYSRLVSRDLFIRKILDGDPLRGMPGYRAVAPVAAHIDEIYRYFVARAGGSFETHEASPAPPADGDSSDRR